MSSPPLGELLKTMRRHGGKDAVRTAVEAHCGHWVLGVMLLLNGGVDSWRGLGDSSIDVDTGHRMGARARDSEDVAKREIKSLRASRDGEDGCIAHSIHLDMKVAQAEGAVLLYVLTLASSQKPSG